MRLMYGEAANWPREAFGGTIRWCLGLEGCEKIWSSCSAIEIARDGRIGSVPILQGACGYYTGNFLSVTTIGIVV